MKALLSIIFCFFLVIVTGRRFEKRNYAMVGFVAFFALLTTMLLIAYMFFEKKPLP